MIRFILPSDERQVKRLMLRYLKATYDEGGDFPPTLDNAQAFFDHAVEGAQCGDPCLVYQHDVDRFADPKVGLVPLIAGFVMARGVPFPGMQTRDNTLRSWGTYVDPEHRGSRIAIKLFMVMGRIAKNRGYTRVLGMTHGTGYEDKAFQVIKSIVGMKEIGKVLLWQLTPPTEGESRASHPEADLVVAGTTE
jgi:GNAT superfamily N-acetyltransferase